MEVEKLDMEDIEIATEQGGFHFPKTLTVGKPMVWHPCRQSMCAISSRSVWTKMPSSSGLLLDSRHGLGGNAAVSVTGDRKFRRTGPSSPDTVWPL